MKKLSFLLGTLGGVMAGYVFSNGKLRKELTDAKDTKEAAKILAKHLAHDGQKVAAEAQQLAKEHNLDAKVAKGKKYVQKYYKTAKSELGTFVGNQVKNAGNAASSVTKAAVKKAKNMM